MSPFSLLYENDEILLVNKPAGVPVQGGQGISHPLDDELSRQTGYRVHLVHRLDKETAGILIVAKNAMAASKWTKLIATPQVQKEYYAVCLGIPCISGRKMTEGTLRGSVEAHGRVQSAELHFCVERTAEVTVPAAEGSDASARTVTLSLVRIKLGTGRMHQIRIQFAKAGAPLAADDQHGDFKQNKLVHKLGIKKLHLAAVRLTLTVEGKSRTFEIALPEHMRQTVDRYLPDRG